MSVPSRNLRVILHTLATKGTQCTDTLYSCLAASQTVKKDLDYMFMTMESTSDAVQKEKILETILNVMSKLDLEQLGMSEGQIIDWLKAFAKYPLALSRMSLYYLFADVLRKIYELPKLTEGEVVAQLEPLMGVKNGAFTGMFVASIMSEKMESLRQKCLDMMMQFHVQTNPYLVLDLAYVLAKSNIATVTHDDLSFGRLKTLLAKCFSPETNLLAKMAGIKLVTSLFTYLGSEQGMCIINENSVKVAQDLLQKDYGAKRLVFEMADAMPAVNSNEQFTIKAQLTALVPHLCAAMGQNEEEFMPKLKNFISKRKDDEMITVALGILPCHSGSYKAGVRLGIGTGTLVRPEIFNEFYPKKFNKSVSNDIMEMIPTVVEATPNIVTAENVTVIIECLFTIFDDKDGVTNNHEVELAARALRAISVHAKEVMNIFLAHAARIASFSTLLSLCSYLMENVREDRLPARDYTTNYCECVATFNRFIANTNIAVEHKRVLINFLRLISNKFGINPEEVELPAKIEVLTRIYIPSEMYDEYCKVCATLIERDSTFSVCCSVLTKLNASMAEKIMKSVDERLVFGEFGLFYSARASIAPGEVLNHLDTVVKNSRGIFKKAPSAQFTKCILNALKLIIERCTLTAKDMDLAVNIVSRAIPKNVDELVAVKDEAVQLVSAVTSKPDAKVPTKLVEEWIQRPMYISSLATLLLKVSSSRDRLSDAVNAWAVYVSESGPISQEMNEATVNSLFQFKNSQETINTMIEILVEYMYKEKDPTEVFKFAATAASLARQRGWKYTLNSLNLLAIASVHVLSPSQPLRIAATQLLIDLYTIPETCEDLRYYKQEISGPEASEIFYVLYTMIFRTMTDKQCLPLFERAIAATPLRNYHVELIHALLAVHGSSYVESRAEPLVRMCSLKPGKLDPLLLSQIEATIINFAKVNAQAFTRYLCTTGMNEMTMNALTRLMMRDDLRNAFIDEYMNILLLDGAMSLSNGTFSMLSTIADADRNNELSGKLLMCCALWFGKILYERTGAKQVKEITRIFNGVLNATPKKISFDSVKAYVESMELYKLDIAALGIRQLNAAADFAIRIAAKGHEYGIVTVGSIFILLMNCYGSYTTPQSARFVEKISGALGSCFTYGSPSTVRVLTGIMNTKFSANHIKRLHDNDHKSIYSSLIESLNQNVPQDLMRNEATQFFCWLVPLTPVMTLAAHASGAIEVMQKAFTLVTPTAEMIKAAHFLCLNGINVVGVYGKTKLNLANITIMASCFSAEIQEEAMKLLKQQTRKETTEEAIQIVMETLDAAAKKALCDTLMKAATPAAVTDTSLHVIQCIANACGENREEMGSFFDGLMDLCIAIITSDNNPCTERANMILKSF